MSAPTDSNSFTGILCDIVLSFGHVAWKSRYMGQFLSSMLASILTQYIDSHVSKLVFSMPTWFRWSLFFFFFWLCIALLQVLLFFYLLLQCHLWLKSHFSMTSMATGFLHLSIGQWPVTEYCILTACIFVHHLMLLFLFFLLSWGLVCPCMTLLHW